MWNSLETQGKKNPKHQWNNFALYSIYIRIPFGFQTNLGMPDIFKGNPNNIGHCFTFIHFGLCHHSPTKHTPRTPKGNAHIETATINEIILKCLQPIGTQTAAAGHLAF